MGWRLVVALGTGWACGCGLLLDADPTPAAGGPMMDAAIGDARSDVQPPIDGAPLDVPLVDAPPDATADGALPDSITTCAMDLMSRLGEVFPVEDIATGCGGTVDLSEEGATEVDMIALDTAGVGYAVIAFATDPGGSGTLQLSFTRPARNLEFKFDWLSYDSALGYDERLTIGVDGTDIVPDLVASTDVYAVGEVVHATTSRGRGRISIPAVDRDLTIRLDDFGTTSGAGVEFYDFVWTER